MMSILITFLSFLVSSIGFSQNTEHSSLSDLLKQVSDKREVYDVRNKTAKSELGNEVGCDRQALRDIANPSIFFGGNAITPSMLLFKKSFAGCPSINGDISKVKYIHYAIPLYSGQKYGYFQDGETFSLYNLRGVPDKALLEKLQKEWENFDKQCKKSNTNPSIKNLFEFAIKLDVKYGKSFLPPIEPKR